MAGGFCPQCGTQRHGELRFCASCGFDFWKAAEVPKDTPGTVAAATPHAADLAKRRSRPWLLWLGAGIAGLVVVGIIGSVIGGDQPGVAGGTTSPSADSTPTRSSSPTARPTERPTTRPTASPVPAGPDRVAVGEVVSIQCGGDPCLEITLTGPSEHAFYAGEYSDERPEQDGWVYMQVYAKYVSLMDAATYNQFDWAIYADGRQLESFAFVIYGPEPTLSSGSLPSGRTAEGWLVYEVPPSGEIILSYEPNFDGPPVFEVVLRSG